MIVNIKWICILLSAIIFCSCEKIGIVEKSKLDSARSDIAQLQSELEVAKHQVVALRDENEELQIKLDNAEKERNEYLNILKSSCQKSERLVNMINNEDYVSLWELAQAVTDLRESLGYKQVYYNYSSQPFQSQQTTITEQPDYLMF